MRKIIKLNPYYEKKIWGYEKWYLSTYTKKNSKVSYSNEELERYIGKKLNILIKVIKADENLSVQVHPNDEYARKYENESGKAECWYVIDAKKNSSIICGIKSGLDRDKVIKCIEENKLEDNFLRIPIKKSDIINIPAGTVHSLSGGIKVLEIQQNSDITYRLYDYNRGRKLDIEKALDVIDYDNLNSGQFYGDELRTEYFTLKRIIINNKIALDIEVDTAIFIIRGELVITSLGEKELLSQNDMIYILESHRYILEGSGELILVVANSIG